VRILKAEEVKGAMARPVVAAVAQRILARAAKRPATDARQLRQGRPLGALMLLLLLLLLNDPCASGTPRAALKARWNWWVARSGGVRCK
jgi:hypothetical protein